MTRLQHPTRPPRPAGTRSLARLGVILALLVATAGCIPGSAQRPSSGLASTSTPRASTAPTAAGSRASTGHTTPASTTPAPATTAPAGTAIATLATRTPQPTSTPSPSAENPDASPPAGPDIQAEPTLAQLVGQKLVVRMTGTTPSAGLLGRIRRGEVGGVILFGDNIVDQTQLKSLTAKLHAAAVAGGRPRLLVMTDQEGGLVRRIKWAAPSMSARDMAAAGAAATRAKGKLTGAALRSLGIDVDLAPVADVPGSTSSFMWLDRRTFGFGVGTVAPDSNAFALGLRDGRTLATMKHFPGIGRATQNTDNFTVSIAATLAALQQRDLVPYTTAIANKVPLIMLSNANYPALDPTNGAGWSRAIARDLLRVQLGFRGVTITDSLLAAARTRGLGVSTLAIAAAASGTDMVLVPSLESATSTVFQKLLAAAQSGAIPLTRLQASYQRILTLKAGL